jgi:hypothetical protein
MPSGSDGYDCFRELIQELRREHFDGVAGKVDSRFHIESRRMDDQFGTCRPAWRSYPRL